MASWGMGMSGGRRSVVDRMITLHYKVSTRGVGNPRLNRASDLVARIALNYALIDGATEVAGEHLAAGMAWQRYSESTVSAVLGGMVRDEIAVRILDALRRGGRYVTRLTDLHNLFGRNARPRSRTAKAPSQPI